MRGDVNVLGEATNAASVSVNTMLASRQGRYFWAEVVVDNDEDAVWLGITNVAVLPVGSGQFAVSNVTGRVFVPETPETFRYDADGNLISDGRWNYRWDGENRLVGVESRSDTPQASWRRVEWVYDGLGRRVRQTTWDGRGGAWEVIEDVKFISDPVLFGRHVAELEAADHALVRSYAWGVDLSGSLEGAGGVGGLLWVTEHSTAEPSTHFVAYDGNRNVMALFAATDGSQTARYEYGPFGEPLRINGLMAKENPFRYSTKRKDSTTDLVLYEYRAYSSGLGRWLSRDPIGELGGPNLYGFVGNTPVNHVDPFGEMRWGDLLRILNAAEVAARQHKCCCAKKTTLSVTISGVASGAQVTHTVDTKLNGDCPLGILSFYWWDCFSAQEEYGNDNSPNRPRGRQAWQDYGWHLGSNPQTQSHRGTPGWLWPVDWNDGNHWNWQAAVLYIACGSDGRFHAKLAMSNALEWTWNNGGWSDPHDGSGGIIQ